MDEKRLQQLKDIMKDKQDIGEETSAEELEIQQIMDEANDPVERSMGSPITGEKLKTVGGGVSRGSGIAVKGIKFKGVF